MLLTAVEENHFHLETFWHDEHEWDIGPRTEGWCRSRASVNGICQTSLEVIQTLFAVRFQSMRALPYITTRWAAKLKPFVHIISFYNGEMKYVPLGAWPPFLKSSDPTWENIKTNPIQRKNAKIHTVSHSYFIIIGWLYAWVWANSLPKCKSNAMSIFLIFTIISNQEKLHSKHKGLFYLTPIITVNKTNASRYMAEGRR